MSSKEEKMQAEAEAKAKIKESIARRKEEARLKKEQKEQELAKQKELERIAAEEKEKTNSEKIKRHKEEIQRQKREEEEKLAKQKQQEEEERQNAELSLKEKIKERKQLVAEQEEQKRLEKEAQKKKEEEERQNAIAEQKRIIEANKEEARAKREAEEKEQQEKERKEQEARKKELAEKKRKRKEELEKQREEKERAEKEQREKEEAIMAEKEKIRKEQQEKRRAELLKQKQEEEEAERKLREEMEEKQRIFEEEQREAMRKHNEEIKRQKEEAKDLESEEQERLAAERAAEFEKEQIRRKAEMERIIAAEEERRKKAEEKIKALGHKAPVNRCGLFTVFGEEPGLEIWVLGDHQISKIAKKKHGLRGLIGESHGSFHVERAYIILHTSFSSGFYHYRLHTWVGPECSEEMKKQAEERLSELEAGLVMDDLETITREFKGEEREEFRAYFDKPIEYVESVTLKTTTGPNYLDKTMYQIKGRNNVHCKRVDARPENLNSGDVFVLEDSFGIYQFNGRKSNKMERGKALDFGVQLRIERNARVRVHIIDEGNPQCEHENNKFWAALRLDRDAKGEFILPEGHEQSGAVGATPTGLELPITPPEESGDDIEFENNYVASWKMYEIRPIALPEDGIPSEDIEIELVPAEMGSTKGPLVSQLSDWNVVILDCDTEIFVWYGNFSSEKARKLARGKAKELADEETRDPCTVVTKVRQQTETYMFKEKFVGSWGEYADFDFTEEHIRGNIANLQQEDVNIDCMYFPEKYANASEDRILPIPNFDKAIESSREIYLVGEHDKIELPESEHGIFYSGNCYLMMYELKFGVDHAGNDKSRHIVYFWQGWHASREDKGLSALLAGDVAKRLRFSQVVRVIQNKEPDHFLSHFAPAMIVCLGKRPSTVVDPFIGKRLYHIRGTNEVNVNACETVPLARNLNTNDSFVLVNSQKVFIWNGLGSNGYEKLASESLASKIKDGEVYEVEEGDEGEAFWEILGSKGEYVDHKKFREGDISAVFFECTNTIGVFKVYRLEEFAQQDLLSRNCVLIDGGDTIFVWVGSDANEKCKEMTLDTAQKYIDYVSDEHPKRPECKIVTVLAGSESLEFQAYFHTWDIKSAADSRDTYQTKINQMRASHTLLSPLPTRRKSKLASSTK
eukprot:CAMPEP_0117014286 /NCGR_PEP_ID=MMETSP0472-20121206/11617_1 /TAXON_ID=693140 ORGANISM="Tiarina fusus, Strain LIS" /NCGR_SAMPLE_ID=MMETSP0472 /ASSEMBLY_ACC=CAM_ASM_000603 /LENGTH=1143 /DNA_ID=CAMNT_0004717805 /DNA_START=62 /DNA_END=3493 /DNA_ORIENTATION=-